LVFLLVFLNEYHVAVGEKEGKTRNRGGEEEGKRRNRGGTEEEQRSVS
jgi:hypothetical protein